jgi:hypothetical protein
LQFSSPSHNNNLWEYKLPHWRNLAAPMKDYLCLRQRIAI